MPLGPGQTFAGYTIVRRLGSGGMGEVYLAQHPRLPRQDALKVLPASVSANAEYRQRFHREADIAATLWHPHIIGVHDRGECEGQLWISMDYVQGTDAAQLLAGKYRAGMPPGLVAAIVSAVGDALDYAHSRHLLHRDVKPANILLSHPEAPEQRILLADFGIARWTDDISGLTATNMTVGTVSYAPPEQLMARRLDGRSDQYALAATAYHLLTGGPPFANSNPAVVISQHLSEAPPAIADRRPGLTGVDPVLAKALAKDPNDRYDRCSDFARAFAHRVGGPAVEDSDATRFSAPQTPLPPAGDGRPARRGPAVVVAAVLAVLLVAAVAVAVVEFRRADRIEAPPSAGGTSAAPGMSGSALPLPTGTTGATSTAPTPATAAIGADCAPEGTTASTANGATAYCSTLQGTDKTIWSLTPDNVASPTVSVTTGAPAQPLHPEEESPVRVCVEQTGQTWLQCLRDIRIGNGQPPS